MVSRYTKRLTKREVLKLLRAGAYRADLETGVVFSGRTGEPIFTYEGNDEGHLFVRLFKAPKDRTLPVSHVVWMAATGSIVPDEFEIHHYNLDVKSNGFDNLYALHKLDHRKWHKKRQSEIETEIPF